MISHIRSAFLNFQFNLDGFYVCCFGAFFALSDIKTYQLTFF